MTRRCPGQPAPVPMTRNVLTTTWTIRRDPARYGLAPAGISRRKSDAIGLLLVGTWALSGPSCMLFSSGEVDPLLVGSVVIVATEGLEAPTVRQPGVFKPVHRYDLTAEVQERPQSPLRFVAFGLTVMTGNANGVDLRLIDRQTKQWWALQRVDRQEFAPGSPPAAVNTLSREALAALASDRGVFWTASSAADPMETALDIHVLLPQDLLGPFMILEAYAFVARDGTPIGGDRIELVEDFFYLAVIGDSVSWGNGLRDREKIWRHVADAIQARTGKRVVHQIHAISGARIVPREDDVVCRVSCHGEVQSATTSITVQVDLIQAPQDVDLVLMTGCANDVGLDRVLDPLIDEQQLAARSQEFCGQAMEDLLAKVSERLPRADVVVTGYYLITSLESKLAGLEEFLEGIGVTEDTGDIINLIGELARNSDIFLAESNASLAEAVRKTNAPAGEDRFFFVESAFGPANAVLAGDPWLFGVGTSAGSSLEPLGLSIGVLPEDPLAGLRIQECLLRDVPVGPLSCVFSSLGHPNPRGARAIAEAIVATLEAEGVLPSGSAG